MSGTLHEHPCKFISQNVSVEKKGLDNNCKENQKKYLMSNAVQNTESNKGKEVQENSS